MTLRKTTQPTSEPVTLATAKLHLRVDVADDDAYITTLIVAARTACEERLERSLITTGWTLTLDAFPEEISLPSGPVISVTSLQYLDTNGATQTLAGSLLVGDVIYPAYATAWPDTREQANAVTVVYTAGYGAAADVPAPIVQWILLAVGDMYAMRERSAERPAVAQGFADGLLDTYKVWGV